MHIREDPELKWSKRMKMTPKKLWDKYYQFYQDHRYDTDDCYALKSQIESLIEQEKLVRFEANQQQLRPQSNRGKPHPDARQKQPTQDSKPLG
jgi:hypothetical protein